MRYAVTTAAVFGAALFLAPSSAAATSNDNLRGIIKPSTAVTAKVTTPVASRASLASAPAATQPVPAPADIVVAAGDNLSTLAAAAGISYRRLYDANPAVTNPDLIYPGQELRIPTTDEQLTARELPANAPAAAVAEPITTAKAAPTTVTAPTATAPAVATGSIWDQLAMCESGGNWAINTGNGFYGGLQFTLTTWQSLGGSGYPHQASREEQINRAEMLLARSGWGQWPACTTKLGLR